MKQENKHIYLVMFSNFDASGGGRETWVNWFINELNKDESLKLQIIGIDDNNKNKISSYLKYSEYFYTVKVPKKSNSKFLLMRAIVASIRLLSFYLYVLKFVFREKQSHFIALDSMYSVLPLYIFKKFNSNFKYSVWLRTILEKIIYHQYPSQIRNILINLEKKFLANSDRIISNGWDTQLFYKQNKGIDSTVIPNAVNTNKYSFHNEIKFCDRIIISFIGRLSKEKGIEEFLKLIDLYNNSENKQKFFKLDFHIVGSGPYEEKIKLQNIDNLKFLGPIQNDKMEDYLKSIHIGVHLNLSKTTGGSGISNSLLEQMAAGKIILTWNNSIFTQILDKENSYMCDEGDCECLNENLIHILNNKNDAYKKALLSYEKSKDFSLNAHIKLFKNFIKDLK